LETVVFRSFAIAGKPGRYISIEKGARAVSDPKIRIKRKYLLLFIVLQIYDLLVKHNVRFESYLVIVLLPDCDNSSVKK